MGNNPVRNCYLCSDYDVRLNTDTIFDKIFVDGPLQDANYEITEFERAFKQFGRTEAKLPSAVSLYSSTFSQNLTVSSPETPSKQRKGSKTRVLSSNANEKCLNLVERVGK